MRSEVEIVGEITNIEVIAVSQSIRERDRLRRQYGQGRWRKLKGIALVRLPDNSIVMAEIHWYEASNIGKRDIKVKRMIR
jgi:hypothetical protein